MRISNREIHLGAKHVTDVLSKTRESEKAQKFSVERGERQIYAEYSVNLSIIDSANKAIHSF